MEQELISVRRFPAETDRVETGPIMFGDDWPGIFIRGDDSFFFVQILRGIAQTHDESIDPFRMAAINSLADLLEQSNCRNNDAFPSWHIKGEGEPWSPTTG